MDMFPSVMEWLRIPIDPAWDIDGKSRLQYDLPDSQKCDLSQTKPSILLTGAYAYSAHDAENINDESQLAVDQCLSRATDSGRFHYDIWSPCAVSGGSASTSVAPGLCSDDQTCSADQVDFSKQNGYTSSEPQLIGLARDGHLLYGPQGFDGVSVDECNGYTQDGNYVYASRSEAPYTITCWGAPASGCGVEWDYIF